MLVKQPTEISYVFEVYIRNTGIRYYWYVSTKEFKSFHNP